MAEMRSAICLSTCLKTRTEKMKEYVSSNMVTGNLKWNLHTLIGNDRPINDEIEVSGDIVDKRSLLRRSPQVPQRKRLDKVVYEIGD